MAFGDEVLVGGTEEAARAGRIAWSCASSLDPTGTDRGADQIVRRCRRSLSARSMNRQHQIIVRERLWRGFAPPCRPENSISGESSPCLRSAHDRRPHMFHVRVESGDHSRRFIAQRNWQKLKIYAR